VDAAKVAKLLDAEKAIFFGDKLSLFGVSEELGHEILRLIELITPANCSGYAVVNGESLVFSRGEETIIAFVDEDRVMGTLRRLTQNV
jgi:hypothetical protein